MKLRTRAVRRATAVLGAAGIAVAMLVILPADAQTDVCTELRQRYIENPQARALLLPYLQQFNCGVPTVGSTTSSTVSIPSTTSTSIAVTTTTINPGTVACAVLQAQYIAFPDLRAQLLPLLQANGCTVPPVSTSTTQPATTTSSSSSTTSSSTTSSSTTSSSTTSTTAATTTTTIAGGSATCAALREAYNQTTDPQARALLLIELARFNCAP